MLLTLGPRRIVAISRPVFIYHRRLLHSSIMARHSHDHGHSHTHSSADSAFSQEKGGIRNPAIRITWIGLLANVGMAVGKGVGGVVFHSQALIADSMHAVSDLFSDFLTLATVSLSGKPPTAHFPNGFGRVEALGSFGVSALLIFAGVSMGWSSLISMLQHVGAIEQLPELLQFGHSHSHSHSHSHDDVADINAAWLALASIGIKEWLYHATMRVSKQTGSQVLVANAWHHRVDSLVSMVAVATIAGGHFFHINWLDPLGGLVVSSMIVRAGWGTTRQSVYELADCNDRLEPEVEPHREQVRRILSAAHLPIHVTDITLMPSGPNYTAHVNLHLTTTESIQADVLKRAHEVVTTKMYEQNPRLRRVTVTIV